MDAAIQNEQIASHNRRAYLRGTVTGTMLVFFGPGRWGKLMNLSEGGMAFEFQQPPPVGELLRFGLEAMGRAPNEAPDRPGIDYVFAQGQVVWTWEFERSAGVQFVDVTEESRQQIRQWLAMAPSSAVAAEGERVQDETSKKEAAGSLESRGEADSQESVVDTQGRSAERPDSALLEAEGSPFDQQPRLEEASLAESLSNRVVLKRMAPWLLVLAVLAGLAVMILSPRAHLFARFGGSREQSVSSSGPPPDVVRSAARPTKAFQVEVVDSNNRKRLLTFDGDAATVQDRLSSGAPGVENSNQPPPASAAHSADRSVAQNRRAPAIFKPSRPRAAHPAGDVSVQNAPLLIGSGAPGGVVNTDTSAPDTNLGRSAEGILSAPPLPAGGQVEAARLISSMLPAYPLYARAFNIQGEVTMDALIDAAGKVTSVTAIAGHPLLREAAMDAVRRWRYEPARLNGQPVPSRLSVTVKFRHP